MSYLSSMSGGYTNSTTTTTTYTPHTSYTPNFSKVAGGQNDFGSSGSSFQFGSGTSNYGMRPVGAGNASSSLIAALLEQLNASANTSSKPANAPLTQEDADYFNKLGGALNFNSLVNNGSAQINPDSKDALRRLALTMDSKPEIYGKPESGAPSWLIMLNQYDISKLGRDDATINESLSNGVGAKDAAAFSKAINDTLAPHVGHFAGRAQNDFNVLSKALAVDGRNKEFGLLSADPATLDALRRVALWMDSQPGVYSKPDGRTGTWLNEINEDRHLTKAETTVLSKAISDYLNQAKASPVGGQTSSSLVAPSVFNSGQEKQMQQAMQQTMVTMLMDTFMNWFATQFSQNKVR